MVICKISRCPFYIEGFCSNKVTAINENGDCQQIWRRGVTKPDRYNPIENIYKKQIVIMDYQKPIKPQEKYHQITINEYLMELENNEKND